MVGDVQEDGLMGQCAILITVVVIMVVALNYDRFRLYHKPWQRRREVDRNVREMYEDFDEIL